MFKPSNDPINANDAVVLKSLEKYTILMEHLNTKINSLSYNNAHTQSIGDMILDGMEDKDFYDPMAYGALAIEHLSLNIRAHQARYYALAKESPDQTPNFKLVQDILNVDLKKK